MPRMLVVKPSEVKQVFTGSVETEEAIRAIIGLLAEKGDCWDVTIAGRAMRKIITNEHYIKVLHTGRVGPGERYKGSKADDDTGGYLEKSGSGYKVTKKLIASCW